MASNSKRWTKIEQRLDQILDQREASEREREAKVMRVRGRNSARPGGSTPSGAGAARPKPRRGE